MTTSRRSCENGEASHKDNLTKFSPSREKVGLEEKKGMMVP